MWTTERPTKPGYYWWRKHENGGPVLLKVSRGFNGYVAWTLLENGKSHKYVVDDLIGEWQPVQGPRE